MFKYLFFDDQKLYKRKNLKRIYGTPKLIENSIYYDGFSNTSFRSPYVFERDDGKYIMLYEGSIKNKDEHLCLAAISDDGIRFAPYNTCDILNIENRVADNEVFELHGEIAEIFEDKYACLEERYKALMFGFGPNHTLPGICMVSPDLLHWKKIEAQDWNDGAEPIIGVFYNKKRECHTILRRPDWGTRRVGYVETKDFRTYTPYEFCLQVDSLDVPLAELYGMPAMVYGDYYIGFPYIYSKFNSENITKVEGGTIEAQLAYSFDGHHWQRSLRTPFISGMTKENEAVFGYKNPLCWASCFRIDNDQNIIIHASLSREEHGPAFRGSDLGRIASYQLRKDGFICLTTENAEIPSIISTRENIWNSGELNINICCKNATVAVYESIGDDALGTAHKIEGYSHRECIAFSGDSTKWVPQFKSGKTLNALSGKTLIFELKFENGTLFSIEGDCTPVMNLEGVRYRQYNQMPKNKTFF